MKNLVILLAAVTICSCSHPDIKAVDSNTYVIKRPIQAIAMTEPGLNGARNYLTLDAKASCPDGWVTNNENIIHDDKKQILVWEIDCKN